ncbi:fasciclin domain-containing protein [Candidatus Gracilibacteria bacterium]|nr:fasciclin domain-containing protein [Candidatus Gracilibacteria bacterium]MCF7819290.1 fasciclin domain-containing protein [Candidatus Gracilibacteria bacterium]
MKHLLHRFRQNPLWRSAETFFDGRRVGRKVSVVSVFFAAVAFLFSGAQAQQYYPYGYDSQNDALRYRHSGSPYQYYRFDRTGDSPYAEFDVGQYRAGGAQTLSEVVAQEPRLSMFASWIREAGLEYLLYTPDGVTIFAPTNEAIARLSETVKENLEESTPALRATIVNHILNRKYYFDQIPLGKTSSRALSDTNLYLDKRDHDILYIGESEVVKENLVAGNAVIHLVDEPIMPSAYGIYRESRATGFSGRSRVLPNESISRSRLNQRLDYINDPQTMISDDTVADVIRRSSALGTFEEWLQDTGWMQYLETAQDVTVFVPVDEVFEEIPNRSMYQFESSPLQKQQLVNAHVVPGTFYARDFRNNPTGVLETQAGQFVEVDAAGSGNIMIGAARIVRPDIQAQNGVIHLVNGFVRPERDSSLQERYSFIEPAPRFISQDELGMDRQMLTPPIPKDFERLDTVDRLLEVKEQYRDDRLVSVLEQSPAMEAFEDALSEAGLKDDLDAVGQDVTLFVPTNNAFSDMGDAQFRALLNDRPALRRFVRNHMLVGNFDESQLGERFSRVQNFNGNYLDLSAVNGTKVEEARVIGPDVHVSNGVIHIIDKVLD